MLHCGTHHKPLPSLRLHSLDRHPLNNQHRLTLLGRQALTPSSCSRPSAPHLYQTKSRKPDHHPHQQRSVWIDSPIHPSHVGVKDFGGKKKRRRRRGRTGSRQRWAQDAPGGVENIRSLIWDREVMRWKILRMLLWWECWPWR